MKYIRFHNGGHVVPIPDADLDLMLSSKLCFECDEKGHPVKREEKGRANRKEK